MVWALRHEGRELMCMVGQGYSERYLFMKRAAEKGWTLQRADRNWRYLEDRRAGTDRVSARIDRKFRARLQPTDMFDFAYLFEKSPSTIFP